MGSGDSLALDRVEPRRAARNRSVATMPPSVSAACDALGLRRARVASSRRAGLEAELGGALAGGRLLVAPGAQQAGAVFVQRDGERAVLLVDLEPEVRDPVADRAREPEVGALGDATEPHALAVEQPDAVRRLDAFHGDSRHGPESGGCERVLRIGRLAPSQPSQTCDRRQFAAAVLERIDQNGHGPVVHQLDLPCAPQSVPVATGVPAPERGDERGHERRRLRRRRGRGPRRPAAPPGVAVEGELAHDERGAAGRGQRKVHGPCAVVEHAQLPRPSRRASRRGRRRRRG